MLARFAPAARHICFLALLFISPADAGSDLRFERLTLSTEVAGQQDNLSAVRATVKDARGYIWFGGENGLARYDGNELVIYQTQPDNPRSLSANFVWSLTIDHEGVLWVATGRGLNRYNESSDDFDRFFNDESADSISNNNINSLAVDHQNHLIIGTANGLSILNPQRTRFTSYYHHPEGEKGLGQNHIREVFVDSRNTIWVGTTKNGLNKFDRSSGTFSAYLHDPNDPQSLIDNDVSAIEEDSEGRLWIGTYNHGLSRMNTDSASFTNYKHELGNSQSLSGNNISDIHEDQQGNLWLAVDHGGLNIYNPEADTFTHHKHSPYNVNSLSSDQPRSIFEDDQSNLWFGMFPTGVMFLDREAAIFTNYFHKPDDPYSLSNNGVLCFFEDSEGTLWIGTEGGLNAFDQNTGRVTRYFVDETDHKQSNTILTIDEDAQGNLWLGTWSGGLHKFNKKTGEVITYFPQKDQPKGISSAFIWKVLRDSNDNLWVATETDGMSRYDPATDSFVHYTASPSNPEAIISNQVWTLMEDRNNYIWVATLEGLSRFNRNTETASHYLHDPDDATSISSRQIISLFEDSRGNIWVGTRDAGLNLLNDDNKTFTVLNVQHGLPSATVSSIIEDNTGTLWITTVNGIASINPDTLSIKSYNQAHGLASNNFNRDATFKDKFGNLYVGSIGGFSVFNPESFSRDPTPPPVVLTGVRVMNKPIGIGDEDGLLKQAISLTDTITFSKKHTMFSFHFAALSYRSAASNQYAYMLEGFDQDWIHIGTQRTATYTNIDPGQYTFRVKAANRDGVWNHDGLSMDIVIKPPLWRTWWAYLSYVLITLALLYMVNKYKNLRITSNVYRKLSATDALTGIANRVGLAQVAEEAFGKSAKPKGIGLLVFDIDHFKQINDNRGHDSGDRVLAEFAEVINNKIRSGDSFARWGGEEFVVLTFGTNREGLLAFGEKLRTAIATHEFEREYQPLHITVSIGMTHAKSGESFEQVFKRADTALYEAKAAGRNRVIFAG